MVLLFLSRTTYGPTTTQRCRVCRATAPVRDAQDNAQASIHVMTIHPGDRITGSVTRIAPGRFRLTLADSTTGKRFAITKAVPGARTLDAVVIAELPKRARPEPQVSQPFSLAAFGSVTFTACRVDGKPLGSLKLWPIQMLDDEFGDVSMTVSNVVGNGTSFTVSEPQS